MNNRSLTISMILLACLIAGLGIFRYESRLSRLADQNKRLQSLLEESGRNHYPAPSRALNTNTMSSASVATAPAAAATDQQVKDLSEALEALREHNAGIQERLDQLLRPIDKDILSTTLRTDVRHDEILVTGGVRTIDGNYHYTFVIPASEMLDDGSEGIRMRTVKLNIAPDALESLGLDFLATNAGNTLQHGEIWTDVEFSETFRYSQSLEGVEWQNLPDITTISGESVLLEDGDFVLNARPEHLADFSGFDLDLRVEQARDPDNPPEP